jgi:hypothetical protein
MIGLWIELALHSPAGRFTVLAAPLPPVPWLLDRVLQRVS